MFNEPKVEPPKTLWPQCIAGLTATIGGLILGSCIGWSGPAIPMLLNSTITDFSVTKTECNFVASLMPGGALFGGLLGGWLIDKFGRKGTMLGNSVLFTIAFLILSAACNVWMLYFGRFLSGMASGITTIATPTYVAEIASSNIRGMLGSSFQKISLTLRKEDFDGARKSLYFLRGHELIDMEIASILINLEDDEDNRFEISHLLKPYYLKPLGICLVIMIGQQMCGYNAVIFFSINIFEDAHTKLDSMLENIIIGSVQVIVTGLATIFIDKVGRRVLLITSALFMMISLYGLGFYFWYLHYDTGFAMKISFLPLASLCTYIIAFSIGIGPVPWLIMSELYSPEAKGIASSITSSFTWMLAFLVTLFFVPMKDTMGTAPTFWLFAGFLLAVMIFAIFCVPETKGKSLEEIQAYFRGGFEDENQFWNENNQQIMNIETASVY